jgi:hypothetical protein
VLARPASWASGLLAIRNRSAIRMQKCDYCKYATGAHGVQGRPQSASALRRGSARC